MPGSPSRRRRKEATHAACEAVYQTNAAPYADELNPFSDERQRAIFEKSYCQWRELYLRNEALNRELAEIYGGAQ